MGLCRLYQWKRMEHCVQNFRCSILGSPQRRRRIYLVADFRGGRAKEILFEQEGLRGPTAQSGTQGQEIAEDIGNGIKADDRKRNCLTAYSFDSLSSNSMKSKNPFSGCRVVEVSKTLDTSTPDPSKNQGGIAIVQKVVVYDARGNGDGKLCPTITGDHNNRVTDYTALCCEEKPVVLDYIVRRLTPTECARLQGFPSKWGFLDAKEDFTEEEYKFWLEVRNTYAKINGKAEKDYTKAQILIWYNKLHTNSAEYKMWGNGIALPNALYVMQGISR